MLRRTVEQPDRNLVFHTSDDRNPVDLGAYASYVHKGDEKRDIEFAFQWNCAVPLRVEDKLHKRKIDVETMGFSSHVGLGSGKHERVIAKGMTYRLNPGNGATTSVRLSREDAGAKYQLHCEGYEPVRKQMRVWPLPAPARFYGFPDELYAYYQNVESFADMQLELERVLRNIHYLGPLRQYPRREYSWTGQTPGDVGFQGEHTVATLLAGADRSIGPGGRKRYQPLQGYVGGWLKRLGIVEDFRLVQVSKLTRTYQVRLKMPGQAEVTLPDVGFGVSQVLPVVTTAFCAPANATIIIEQPELHLHPAVQSELADMFIEAIRLKEHGAERNVQFLIESHSEHFLRRLQRRMAEEELRPEDVAVYFCQAPNGTPRSTARTLEMDQYGRVRNWPKNFFGDQMTDIAQMTMRGVEREAREAGRAQQ